MTGDHYFGPGGTGVGSGTSKCFYDARTAVEADSANTIAALRETVKGQRRLLDTLNQRETNLIAAKAEAESETLRWKVLYKKANSVCESVERWDSLPCECDVPGSPCYRCDEWLTVERDIAAHNAARKAAGIGGKDGE